MKVSIVTVSLNDPELGRTIRSVIGQTYAHIDYIVIDGGSVHPATLDALDNFQENPGLRIYVEPDEGIYDAMNKGIRLAQGDYILFLNSGDQLFDENAIHDFVASGFNQGIVYGDLEYGRETDCWTATYPNVLRFSYLAENYLPHPACFFRRELFEKYGGYDKSLSVVADWAFIVKAICAHNVSYQHLPRIISRYFLGGVSSDPAHHERVQAQRADFLHKTFPLFMTDHAEDMMLRSRFRALKDSRLRKCLAMVFKQFDLK